MMSASQEIWTLLIGRTYTQTKRKYHSNLVHKSAIFQKCRVQGFLLPPPPSSKNGGRALHLNCKHVRDQTQEASQIKAWKDAPTWTGKMSKIGQKGFCQNTTAKDQKYLLFDVERSVHKGRVTDLARVYSVKCSCFYELGSFDAILNQKFIRFAARVKTCSAGWQHFWKENGETGT